MRGLASPHPFLGASGCGRALRRHWYFGWFALALCSPRRWHVQGGFFTSRCLPFCERVVLGKGAKVLISWSAQRNLSTTSWKMKLMARRSLSFFLSYSLTLLLFYSLFHPFSLFFSFTTLLYSSLLFSFFFFLFCGTEKTVPKKKGHE